jgi:hypothetical protein
MIWVMADWISKRVDIEGVTSGQQPFLAAGPAEDTNECPTVTASEKRPPIRQSSRVTYSVHPMFRRAARASALKVNPDHSLQRLIDGRLAGRTTDPHGGIDQMAFDFYQDFHGSTSIHTSHNTR